jgi:hypothetical protein
LGDVVGGLAVGLGEIASGIEGRAVYVWILGDAQEYTYASAYPWNPNVR